MRGIPDESRGRTYTYRNKGDGTIDDVYAIGAAGQADHLMMKSLLNAYCNYTTVNVSGWLSRIWDGPVLGSPDYVYSGEVGKEYFLVQYVEGGGRSAYETEPDIYRYSFMGYSGTFTFGEDGRAVLLETNTPAGELAIEIPSGGNVSGTPVFRIRTGDGYVYTFGESDTYHCASDWVSEDSANDSVSSWRLTEIESRSGNHVRFTYSGPLLSSTSVSKSVNIDRISMTDTQGRTERLWENPEMRRGAEEISNTVTWRALSGIRVDGRCEMSFDYDTDSTPLLTRMTVIDMSGRTVRSCILGYGYSGLRPLLKSVHVSGEGNYRMDYIGEESDDVPVIYDRTRHEDWYGYYSSCDAQPDMRSGESLSGYASRLLSGRMVHDFGRASLLMLKRLTYPSGGYSEYSYEPNRYSHRGRGTNRCAESVTGGVRVKGIGTYVSEGSLKSYRTFIYEDADGSSSGILYMEPHVYTRYRMVSDHLEIERETVSTTTDIGFRKDSHIGYRRVLVRTSTSEDGPALNVEEHMFGESGIPYSERYSSTSSDTPTSSVITKDGWNMVFEDLGSDYGEDGMSRGSLAGGLENSVRTYLGEISEGRLVYTVDRSFVMVSSGSAGSVSYLSVFRGAVYARVCTAGTMRISMEHEGNNDGSGHPLPGRTVSVTGRNARGRVTQLTGHDSRMRTVVRNFTYHDEYGALPLTETVTVDGKVSSSTGYGYRYFTSGQRSVLQPSVLRKGQIEASGRLSGYTDMLTVMSYDGSGNPVSLKDADGHRTEYEWGHGGLHPLSRRKVLEDGNFLETRWTWRPLVGMTSETQPDGTVTEYAMDAHGRLTSVSVGGDVTSRYTYHMTGVDVDDDVVRQPGRNWMMEERVSGTGPSETIMTYYDGLGHAEQKTSVGGSGTGLDLVSAIDTDLYGRTVREYLPYESTVRGGGYVADVRDRQRLWYSERYGGQEGLSAFSSVSYEGWRDGRATGASLPGASLSAHPSTVRYVTNPENSIPVLEPDMTDGSLHVSGCYAERKLLGTVSVDGDGREVTVWTDSMGRTVCEDRGGGLTRTLYGYDFRGNLCWVIQPEGVARLSEEGGTVSSGSRFAWMYCFRNAYDCLGRRTMKWTPGTLPEYFMYDGNGNVVLEQNGVMREKNMWKEYTYDHADRLVRERMLTDRDGSCLVWDGSQVVLKGTAVDMNGTGHVLRLCGYDTPKSGMLGFEDAEGVVTSSDIRAGSVGRLTLESVYTTEGGIGTDRSYYYDRHGNVAQVVERLSDGSVLRTSLSRDLQGRPVRKETVHDDRSGTVHTLSQRFSYDVSGRLLSETSVLDGCEAVVTCGYDASGRLTRRTCGNGAAEETFTSNLQGWETGRTVVVAGGAEAYSSRLTYYDVGLSATPSYTGNISTWSWRREGGTEIGYAYGYDALGRLVSASGHADGIPSESVDTERDIVYDRNGNILGLTRVLGGEPCRQTYVYDGNRRTGQDYMYDSGGNMEADMESLTMAEYSFMNMPKLLFGGQGHELVNSYYLSDGTKIRSDMAKTHRGYMYAGPFRYRSDGGGDYRLDMVRFGGGRFQADSVGTIHAVYIVTDHLGSVRLEVGGDGEIAGRYDYLPFGTLASTCDASGGTNGYLYTGKEYQDGLDVSWYDSGARYQTVHGIFTSPDPLAEDCPHLSPYVYCADNPVNLIDPDGKVVVVPDVFSRQIILSTLTEDESKFIQFDIYGKIDVSIAEKCKSTSENYLGILTLIKSSTTYLYSVSSNAFGDRFYDAGDGENFYYGVTLMPNATNDPSPDNNVYIFTADFLSAERKVINAAHELYGHAYFYELRQQGYDVNPNHVRENIKIGQEWDDYFETNMDIFAFRDVNQQLTERINIVTKQALYNYNSRSK